MAKAKPKHPKWNPDDHASHPDLASELRDADVEANLDQPGIRGIAALKSRLEELLAIAKNLEEPRELHRLNREIKEVRARLQLLEAQKGKEN